MPLDPFGTVQYKYPQGIIQHEEGLSGFPDHGTGKKETEGEVVVFWGS